MGGGVSSVVDGDRQRFDRGFGVGGVRVGFAFAYGRTHGIAWVVPVVGVWTVVAPWVVSGDVATTATIASNVVAGAIAVLLGFAAISLGKNGSR